ncbi:MAG: PEP-CTERM sorting domain-containing protein [Phycisphaerae bacterium]|jgi:hypothetical protein
MKKLACAILCVGLAATMANATELGLFFSTTDDLAAAPTASNPELTLNCGESETVYIWAKVDVSMGDSWLGVDLGISGVDTIGFEGMYYNPDMNPVTAPAAWRYRWNGGLSVDDNSEFPDTAQPGVNPIGDYYLPFEDNHVNGVGVGVPSSKFLALGSDLDTMMVMDNDWIYGYYLLGEATFTCPDPCGGESYEIFLAVGPGGIASATGGPGDDSIQFGVGDDPILNDDYWGTSSVADLTINCVPEPASLLLLGIAGLALRRR